MNQMRGQRGFSLLEVVVSALIVALVATSAFYFLSSQNTMGVRGNDMLKGANLGKLKMDSLKVVSYEELSSGSDTVSGRYIRSWQVGIVRDGMGRPNGRKTIDLTIYWPLTGETALPFASIKSDDKYKAETE